MALIERDAALEQIGNGRLAAIYQQVAGGWNDYAADYSLEQRLVIHSKRSRASIINDHVVHRAAKYAAANSDCAQIIKKQHMNLLVFDASIAVRFKKFDERLRTSNQPSSQVWRFKSQMQLEGVPAAHHLEAGYIVDDDEQALSGVHLICPSGIVGVYWDAILTNDANFAVIDNLFAKTIEKEEQDEGARVKRRREAKVIQLKTNDDKG